MAVKKVARLINLLILKMKYLKTFLERWLFSFLNLHITVAGMSSKVHSERYNKGLIFFLFFREAFYFLIYQTFMSFKKIKLLTIVKVTKLYRTFTVEIIKQTK